MCAVFVFDFRVFIINGVKYNNNLSALKLLTDSSTANRICVYSIFQMHSCRQIRSIYSPHTHKQTQDCCSYFDLFYSLSFVSDAIECGACYKRKWRKTTRFFRQRRKAVPFYLTSGEQQHNTAALHQRWRDTQWNDDDDDDDDNFIWFGWFCCGSIYFDFCVQTFTNSSLSYLNQHIPFASDRSSELSPTTCGKTFAQIERKNV